jgi:hypothetical protein
MYQNEQFKTELRSEPCLYVSTVYQNVYMTSMMYQYEQ